MATHRSPPAWSGALGFAGADRSSSGCEFKQEALNRGLKLNDLFALSFNELRRAAAAEAPKAKR
jgi:hypothetical protein